MRQGRYTGYDVFGHLAVKIKTTSVNAQSCDQRLLSVENVQIQKERGVFLQLKNIIVQAHEKYKTNYKNTTLNSLEDNDSDVIVNGIRK